MQKAEPVRVKYVFLDIVGFTHHRSVEAQSYLVEQLNRIVREAMSERSNGPREVVFLPTGDGMCIGLIEDPAFDSHLELALVLLERIAAHNATTDDEMRRFEVRIGLNENIDNIVTDINGRRNLAGAGINIAQRVMATGDASQVLLGQPVFEILGARERFMKCLRAYSTTDKHGTSFRVYQYVDTDARTLNSAVPTIFCPKEAPIEHIPEVFAYYLLEAIKNRNAIGALKDVHPAYAYIVAILLWFRALDLVDEARRKAYEKINPNTWHSGSASFEEQFQYYAESDIYVVLKLFNFLAKELLNRFRHCFDCPAYYSDLVVYVSEAGRERLAREWPQIAARLEGV